MNEAAGGTSSQKAKVLTGAAALVMVALLGWLFIGQEDAPPEADRTADAAPDTAKARPEPAAVIAAVEASVEKAVDQAEQAVAKVEDPAVKTAAEVADAVAKVEEAASQAAGAVEQPVEAVTERATAETTEPAQDTATALAQTKFDLFRAEQDGSIVVAGQATPNSLVEIFVDGKRIGEARASSSGEYTALVDAGAAIVDRMLTLRVTGEDGISRDGSESIVVAASDVEAPVVVADDQGARVLKGASEQLVIDTLAEGALAGGGVISGRGAPQGALLRAYMDNAEVGLAAAAPDGSWRIELPGIGVGRHLLRVDALDAAGKVIARAETEVVGAAEEIAKTAPEAETRSVTAVAVPADQLDQPPPAGVRRVTIERGNTLWAIARETYGEGVLYVRVFEANRDQIRDPDLIYPGQVFDLPE